MIRVGVWPTVGTTHKPILTYKCNHCGNEDIAMTNVKHCGACNTPIPNVDLLYDDSMARIFYHTHGECK